MNKIGSQNVGEFLTGKKKEKKKTLVGDSMQYVIKEITNRDERDINNVNLHE